MLYDVDIEASACVLSSRYAMLCYACSNKGVAVVLVKYLERGSKEKTRNAGAPRGGEVYR